MASVTRVAACHLSPVFLNAQKTTEKAIWNVHNASKHKANLVVFPESFIPAFPLWSALRPPTENHDFFRRMVHESIFADGDEISAIRSAAQSAGVMVSIGISEKVRYSSATLFNSNLIIGQDGSTLVHHRKLMPTFFEKLTWSPGDGAGLCIADTPYGKIGNLICGENTNPLARYALIAQGEQIHISSWPPAWPTRALTAPSPEQDSSADEGPDPPTTANYDNVTANRIRAAAHCFEAKCFGVLCSGYLDSTIPPIVASNSVLSSSILQTLSLTPRGITTFLSPTGATYPSFTIDPVTGVETPTDYLQDKEDVLFADLDLEQCIEGKQYHDVVGGYQRFDIFDLKVNRRRRRHPVDFND